MVKKKQIQCRLYKADIREDRWKLNIDLHERVIRNGSSFSFGENVSSCHRGTKCICKCFGVLGVSPCCESAWRFGWHKRMPEWSGRYTFMRILLPNFVKNSGVLRRI